MSQSRIEFGDGLSRLVAQSRLRARDPHRVEGAGEVDEREAQHRNEDHERQVLNGRFFHSLRKRFQFFSFSGCYLKNFQPNCNTQNEELSSLF